MYTYVLSTKKIVKTNVILKYTRPRGGLTYREKTKQGYEKNRVPFTICSARLFGGSRASARVRRSMGSWDSFASRGPWQGSKSGRSTREVEKHVTVACLAPRLTRTVYCSSPEALGTSLAGIAARGFLS